MFDGPALGNLVGGKMGQLESKMSTDYVLVKPLFLLVCLCTVSPQHWNASLISPKKIKVLLSMTDV